MAEGSVPWVSLGDDDWVRWCARVRPPLAVALALAEARAAGAPGCLWLYEKFAVVWTAASGFGWDYYDLCYAWYAESPE